MPKGQLSRVPWPGNSCMPITSQSASAASQTFTLSYFHWTITSVHSICFIDYFCSKRNSSKYCAAASKHRNGTWKGH